MAVDREAIYVALFTKLQAIQGITTASRRFRDISQVPPVEQPALFLIAGDEKPTYAAKHIPPIWVLDPAILLYVRTDDETKAPSEILNPFLKAIDAALEFTAGDAVSGQYAPTTLGKLVSHCRIEAVHVWEGIGKQSGWGGAEVHLSIMVAGQA